MRRQKKEMAADVDLREATEEEAEILRRSKKRNKYVFFFSFLG